MAGLFPPRMFAGFGPSAYLAGHPEPRCSRTAQGKASRLRSQVRLLAPRRSGVYGIVDDHEELIYVGKAKNLRARLLSYFRPRSRPRKAARIIGRAACLLWEVWPSEFASLLRELELIRRWRPRGNIQGQPLRRQLTFLCLGRAPAPYAFLAAQPPRTAQSVYGPIPAGPRAQEAVRRLNDAFLLRDCPQAIEMVFPEQGELFQQLRAPGCLRIDLGACLGPCTGGCTRPVYHGQVKRASDFLAGLDPGPLPALEKQMQEAAAAEQFERATALRDRLAPLQWLSARLERLRQARGRMSFAYPVAGPDGVQTWYLIHGARALGAVPAPTDAASAEQARCAIVAAFRDQRSGWLREAYEHADGMAVVMAWFRKHPGELKKTIVPDKALALCLPLAG